VLQHQRAQFTRRGASSEPEQFYHHRAGTFDLLRPHHEAEVAIDRLIFERLRRQLAAVAA
jgi:hypothetical protein